MVSGTVPVSRLFDANAQTYDRVNTIISLGLDARWREWAARKAVRCAGDRVLDAFGGTGGVAVRMARRSGIVTLADASEGMIRVARARAQKDSLHVDTVLTDLVTGALPWGVGTFDAITVVFGIRYLAEPAQVLHRLAESLVPGGRLVILEFVAPGPEPIARLASLYFFHVLPVVASALAGSGDLYHELTRTTRRLEGPEAIRRIVESAGLRMVERKSMGFGLVVGVVAEASGQGEGFVPLPPVE